MASSTLIPEILAPVGNMLKLKVAVMYGADAVYLAGPRFGLRYAADNFSEEQLREACVFAHQHGVKVFVTLNAFLFDEDMHDLPAFVAFLQEIDVDAVIVSDAGVARVVREHSSLNIHVSTQSSTLNTWSARFWAQLGAKRVVLGRETSLAAAKAVREGSGLEVEMFVHGSMCMAFSGNCTISNYTAGRDSNRGGCSHSCRYEYGLFDQSGHNYGEGHFMSSKDLNALRLIPQFVQAGIDSFKIEGRMKSALYVATTVQAYRHARDAACGRLSPVTHNNLDDLPNRGYTEASLIQAAGTESIALQKKDQAVFDMAGYVLDTNDQSQMAVFLNHPVEKGQRLELLSPAGENVPVQTGKIIDVRGRLVDRGNPNSVVLLPRPEGASAFMVLRLQHAS